MKIIDKVTARIHIKTYRRMNVSCSEQFIRSAIRKDAETNIHHNRNMSYRLQKVKVYWNWPSNVCLVSSHKQ